MDNMPQVIYDSNMGGDNEETPYDRIAVEYDSLFGDHNPYYTLVNRCEWGLFEDWVQRAQNNRLALDIGCGTGFHTKWLSDYGFDAVGIDKSKGMIDTARIKSASWQGRGKFKVMEVKDLNQMPEKAFSVVLCLGSVLNHLDDWSELAKLVSARLVDGGMFLFSYDNIDGIDVIARSALRQFTGYSESYIRDILVGRIKARVVGRSFNNHWLVRTRRGLVEVPLRYEQTKKWRLFLQEAGLQVCEFRGSHVLDCFDRSMLQASAGINFKNAKTNWLRSWLIKSDRIIARRLYRIAANIVGIAVKRL